MDFGKLEKLKQTHELLTLKEADLEMCNRNIQREPTSVLDQSGKVVYFKMKYDLELEIEQLREEKQNLLKELGLKTDINGNPNYPVKCQECGGTGIDILKEKFNQRESAEIPHPHICEHCHGKGYVV